MHLAASSAAANVTSTDAAESRPTTDAANAPPPDPSDSMPVWEETQSQSVDGTEEVTQDYMVAEQNARYKERQAQKAVRFQENMATYYRKHPLKEKSVPVVDEGNDQVTDDYIPAPKRNRTCVRKVKGGSGVSPVSECPSSPPFRHSPRVSAMSVPSGIAEPSSFAPRKSKLGKSVPVVSDEDSMQDDDSDFETAPKV